jgi:hypothetical protein
MVGFLIPAMVLIGTVYGRYENRRLDINGAVHN